jgi:hypothetical protein
MKIFNKNVEAMEKDEILTYLNNVPVKGTSWLRKCTRVSKYPIFEIIILDQEHGDE